MYAGRADTLLRSSSPSTLRPSFIIVFNNDAVVAAFILDLAFGLVSLSFVLSARTAFLSDLRSLIELLLFLFFQL